MQASTVPCRYTSVAHSPIVQVVELDAEEVTIQGLSSDKRNKFITIPDVFHQLHCLVSGGSGLEKSQTHRWQNQIRLALVDADYLANVDVKRHMHIGEAPWKTFQCGDELISCFRSLHRLLEAGNSMQGRHDAVKIILQRLGAEIDGRLRRLPHM